MNIQRKCKIWVEQFRVFHKPLHPKNLVLFHPPQTPTVKTCRWDLEAPLERLCLPWSGAPCHYFQLEVVKNSSVADQLDVYGKRAYMFGLIDLHYFFHAVLHYFFHAVLQLKTSVEDAYTIYV